MARSTQFQIYVSSSILQKIDCQGTKRVLFSGLPQIVKKPSSTIPRIGKKTAERLILKLKDNVGGVLISAPAGKAA